MDTNWRAAGHIGFASLTVKTFGRTFVKQSAWTGYIGMGKHVSQIRCRAPHSGSSRMQGTMHQTSPKNVTLITLMHLHRVIRPHLPYATSALGAKSFHRGFAGPKMTT